MSHPAKSCAFCETTFTPRAYTQRFCSEACRVKMPWTPRIATPKAPELSAVERAARDLLTRCTATGWGIEHRRERNYNLWGECLGVSLEAA